MVRKPLGQSHPPVGQVALQLQQRHLALQVRIQSAPLDEVRGLSYQVCFFLLLTKYQFFGIISMQV
jgi:hypothetical protein